MSNWTSCASPKGLARGERGAGVGGLLGAVSIVLALSCDITGGEWRREYVRQACILENER